MEQAKPAGPTIRRGQSKQDYRTPQNFMESVIARFGGIGFDLAAHDQNTQHFMYFKENENSLLREWHSLKYVSNKWLWLNPPFDNIEPWAKKCAVESKLGASILFLTPASIGSCWFRDWVQPHAYTLALNPRLSFDGKSPYPKDCILSVYCSGLRGFDTWNWKQK